MIIGELIEAAVEIVLQAVPWPSWMWTVVGVVAAAAGVVLFWFAPSWLAGMVVAMGLLMIMAGIYSKD